jgi:glucose-6-phosphate-specific signal transduction histidine kinase
MITEKLLKMLAWSCLAAIIFVTISPIDMRPSDPLPVNVDRALAFCLMSALFVLAYPERWKTILAVTLIGAGFIEALQFLSPTRHAQFLDAAVKTGGSVVGVLLGACTNYMRLRSTKRQNLNYPR